MKELILNFVGTRMIWVLLGVLGVVFTYFVVKTAMIKIEKKRWIGWIIATAISLFINYVNLPVEFNLAKLSFKSNISTGTTNATSIVNNDIFAKYANQYGIDVGKLKKTVTDMKIDLKNEVEIEKIAKTLKFTN
jgi:hypothetical protein